ncbi:hypothetical protein [uncultured Prevotella sp.]|uniref:hypothetical protein n=1 Tax=uncultured Prevotella sp. TaxID=159272 RepID=UPI00262803A8|nr:hypothetical protein [uncultured Prevotella sp.]
MVECGVGGDAAYTGTYFTTILIELSPTLATTRGSDTAYDAQPLIALVEPTSLPSADLPYYII